ncbi:MAG: hypothetical protein IJI27_02025 [Oscillospiraceae bacterium]|nr:hypothetical protein [Oscillospiraceae bacterium]
MKEKLQNMKEDTKKLLCIIGGITVALGAVFAIVKLCPKKEQKKGKKKK